MKQFLCMIVALAVVLSIGAIAEPAEKESTAYGSVEEIGGLIATYCNEWNDIIGPTFGCDMSFDSSNIEILDRGEWGVLANIDGIDMYMDADLNVFSMDVVISDKSHDAYWTIARCLAIACSLQYDLPKDKTEMKNRFVELLEGYMDTLDHFSRMAAITEKGKTYSTFTLLALSDTPPQNGLIDFYFCLMPGGTWFFSTDELS